jgi:hypothetical protein
VLPRLAAALTQFLSPLISSTSGKKSGERNGGGASKDFKRADLKVLEGGKKKTPEPPPEEIAPVDPEQSVSTGMLQIIQNTERPKRRLLGILGLRVYADTSEKDSRRMLKRGVMMDKKIE